MAETKKVIKWWWEWNFDREEEWLNRMAQQGYALCGVRGILFIFEKTLPEEYVIRMEYQNPTAEYRGFLQELGAEQVGCFAGWRYYRRKSAAGAFEITNDRKGRVDFLRRIERTLLALGLVNIGVGLMNIFNNHGELIWIGALNLLVSCLLFYGIGRIKTKRQVLEKEAELYE